MSSTIVKQGDKIEYMPAMVGSAAVTFILLLLIGFVGHLYFVRSMTKSRLEHIPKARKVKVKKEKKKKGKKGKKVTKEKKEKPGKTDKKKDKKSKGKSKTAKSSNKSKTK